MSPPPTSDRDARREPGAPVSTLPGVTTARREAFDRLGVRTIEDLLRLAPRRYEDRRHPTPIAALVAGTTVLVIGRVVRSRSLRVRRGMAILEATLADETGEIEARWFMRGGWVPQALPVDQTFALYGPVKTRGRRIEMASPARERIPEEGEADALLGAGRLVPVHPLSTGLSAPFVRRAVWNALPAAPSVPDLLPPTRLAANGLPPLAEALRTLHFPETPAEAEAARRRLAFDELLVHELLLGKRRLARQEEHADPVPIDTRLDERIRRRLPFRLTSGQETAVAEITADLALSRPMNRLLQGDVGSGKTAVAAYALLATVARGGQGAFMAPTEVLARQHERTLSDLLSGSRVRLALLTGGHRGKAREEVLAKIAEGEIDLVIGTHAVISRDVSFQRLGLVVVDEQHRFGVRQRHELVAKGEVQTARPHCLVMTATPIPRTLALAVYGDLDVSVIEGRPPGRKPVETMVVRPSAGRRVLARVQQQLAAGHQAFVIYPLVEESDKMGLRDAIDGRARWAKALPEHEVGLLHGRMKRDEKDEVMSAFRAGDVEVLVATVVVEVGIDVPNATVLVVEHAERFGLSQLHQLRGRIGRGAGGGLCVLMDRAKEGETERLAILAETDDGFRIAEEDLKLRGVGDVFGTRQHGAQGFRAAKLPRDLPVLVRAREVAHELLAEDPGLTADEHQTLLARLEARLGDLEETRAGG